MVINVSKKKIELFEENEKFNSYVGDILSKYRRINRISQEKLGGLIGVGRKTISDIELGLRTCNIYILYLIIQALNIPSDEIINIFGIEKYFPSECLYKIRK